MAHKCFPQGAEGSYANTREPATTKGGVPMGVLLWLLYFHANNQYAGIFNLNLNGSRCPIILRLPCMTNSNDIRLNEINRLTDGICEIGCMDPVLVVSRWSQRYAHFCNRGETEGRRFAPCYDAGFSSQGVALCRREVEFTSTVAGVVS